MGSGYCRYPASTVHVQSRYCVQRAVGTCHLTRFCYSAGVTTTVCDGGLCMCKWGYHLEGGKCVVPSYDSAARAEMTMEDLAFEKSQENAVAQNVFIGCAWVAGMITALTAMAGLVYRKLRASENNGYSPLLE